MTIPSRDALLLIYSNCAFLTSRFPSRRKSKTGWRMSRDGWGGDDEGGSMIGLKSTSAPPVSLMILLTTWARSCTISAREAQVNTQAWPLYAAASCPWWFSPYSVAVESRSGSREGPQFHTLWIQTRLGQRRYRFSSASPLGLEFLLQMCLEYDRLRHPRLPLLRRYQHHGLVQANPRLCHKAASYFRHQEPRPCVCKKNKAEKATFIIAGPRRNQQKNYFSNISGSMLSMGAVTFSRKVNAEQTWVNM